MSSCYWRLGNNQYFGQKIVYLHIFWTVWLMYSEAIMISSCQSVVTRHYYRSEKNTLKILVHSYLHEKTLSKNLYFTNIRKAFWCKYEYFFNGLNLNNRRTLYVIFIWLKANSYSRYILIKSTLNLVKNTSEKYSAYFYKIFKCFCIKIIHEAFAVLATP